MCQRPDGWHPLQSLETSYLGAPHVVVDKQPADVGYY
jgi:hypothetical protein